MPVRRLALKREVLQELSASDLVAAVGAAGPVTTTIEVRDTLYSCLDYISCAVPMCYLPPTSICS